MSDAITLLEEEFEKIAETDRESRRLNRAIAAEIAMIEDLTHRTSVEMARIRSSRDSLQKQLHIRHKWLKAVAADKVRERLKIPSIPGYTSPVDELLKRRLDRRNDRADKKLTPSTPPPANDSLINQP